MRVAAFTLISALLVSGAAAGGARARFSLRDSDVTTDVCASYDGDTVLALSSPESTTTAYIDLREYFLSLSRRVQNG